MIINDSRMAPAWLSAQGRLWKSRPFYPNPYYSCAELYRGGWGPHCPRHAATVRCPPGLGAHSRAGGRGSV